VNDRLLGFLVAAFIGAIIAVFIGNFILSAVDPHWTPDTTIGPIMGTVGGGLLAYLLAKQSKKDK
jgi:Ca2+/H+ antiporter